MPQALIPIFVELGMSTIVAEVVANVVIAAAMAAASSLISGAFSPSQEDEGASDNRTADRGQLVNSESSAELLPLIYGRTRVGFNRVYRSLGGTDNEYIHIIGTIGEGEIQGVANIDGVDQLWLDDKLISDPLFSGLVSYEVFTGAVGQNVCATLKAACPEWDDYMPYTAYLYVKLKYDRNVFQNIPDVTMVVDGLKLYDPSLKTTAYSNNPALAARDFLTRSARRGGMGFKDSRLDDATFTSAAEYCTGKGWTIGLAIAEDQSAADNLAQVLSCFRGALIYSGNLYKLKYRDVNYETAVMDVDEHDVVFLGSESTLRISQPSIFDTPNGVCIRFTDEELNYQGNRYVLADPELIEADGGDYREETVTINGINSLTNALKMAAYYLERMRYNKGVSHQGGSRLMALEPMDIINFTHEIPGWSDKLLRVQSIGFDQNGNVNISYAEEDVSYYDDDYDVAEHTKPDTNIIDPSVRPPSVENVTITEEVYSFRERSFTRMKVDFDPPATSTYPYWSAVKVWLKIGSDDYRFMARVEDSYYLDPVNEGEIYRIKLQSVNIWDVEQLLSATTEYSHAVVGKSQAPTSLASLTAIASNDAITLLATAVTDPDIEGYEIRIGGNAWTGAPFFGFYKSPFVRIMAVKPGTHTFWMAPKGNNGLYSASPVSASCEVFWPIGYGNPAANTWSWNFSTGVHSNTEQTTYAGDNVLKCSHEYNLGSNLLTNSGFNSDLTGWTTTSNEASEWDSADGGCIKVVATGAGGGKYQLVTVTPGKTYTLKFKYKNTTGDTAAYAIQDFTHATWIVDVTNMANSTAWSSVQTVDFTAPAECTQIRVFIVGAGAGDVVWFDDVELFEQLDSVNLSGTWTSAEYNLGSVKTVRVWGDFLSVFIGAGNTWDAIFPAGTTWNAKAPPGTTWGSLLAVESVAAVLKAKIKWGNVSGNLMNEADFFQVLAPEFSAQYIQVEVTIVDNAAGSNLYLKTLNMNAAERS